jgi:membrane-bound lytic murein transglycosylase D
MKIITDTIIVTEKVHFDQISAVLDIPIEQIRLLNPQYRKDIIPGNIKPYALCLPLNYANGFIDKQQEILSYKADSLINNRREETEILLAQKQPLSSTSVGAKTKYHTVKKGQTLSYVANKYGVSVTKLQKWNNMKSSKLKIGQRLKILK